MDGHIYVSIMSHEVYMYPVIFNQISSL